MIWPSKRRKPEATASKVMVRGGKSNMVQKRFVVFAAKSSGFIVV